MVSLYEFFVQDIANYGEVTTKDMYSVFGKDAEQDKVFSPSDIIKRKEGIQVFHRDNLRGEKEV